MTAPCPCTVTARLRAATGYKFGQWLDLEYWVMVLHEGDGEPQPVRKTLTDAEIAEAMG